MKRRLITITFTLFAFLFMGTVNVKAETAVSRVVISGAVEPVDQMAAITATTDNLRAVPVGESSGLLFGPTGNDYMDYMLASTLQEVAVDGVFTGGTDYVLKMNIIPDTGYEFAENVVFEYNGEDIASVTELGTSLTNSVAIKGTNPNSYDVYLYFTAKNLIHELRITGTGLYIPEIGDTITYNGISFTLDNSNTDKFEENIYGWYQNVSDEFDEGDLVTAGDYIFGLDYELASEFAFADDFKLYYNNIEIEEEAEGESTFWFDDLNYLGVDLHRDVMNFRDYSYETLAGDESVFKGENLTFKFDGPHYNVREVKINNEIVDPSNYTITKGSTVLTLDADYLDSLDDGLYNINIVYNTDSQNIAEASFRIGEIPENPQTSDNITLYIALSLISLFGLALYTKKAFN